MNTVQSSRNSKNVRMLGSAYLCASVLLTCESLSGGQGYFHREDAKSAKKSDFKNFAFFASSRWIFGVAAGLHCVHLWFHLILPVRPGCALDYGLIQEALRFEKLGIQNGGACCAPNGVEIGRASCRERGEMWGVAGGFGRK